MDCFPLTNRIITTADQILSFDSFVKDREFAQAFDLKREISLEIDKLAVRLRWLNFTETYQHSFDIEKLIGVPEKEFDPACFATSDDGKYLAVLQGNKFIVLDLNSKKEIYSYQMPDDYGKNYYFDTISFCGEHKLTFNVVFNAFNTSARTKYGYFVLDLKDGIMTGSGGNNDPFILLGDPDEEVCYAIKNKIILDDSEKVIIEASKITKLSLSPSGKYLLADYITKEGKPKLEVMFAQTLESVFTFDVRPYAIHPAKDLIARIGATSAVFINRLETNNQTKILHFMSPQSEAVAVTFDRDGAHALAADKDNRIHVLSTDSQVERTHFQADLPE